MKKILFALTVGAALSTAQAAISFTETFDYPDGSLTTNSGGLWITHSGTAGQMQVSGGQAIVSGAQSEDVHRIGTPVGAGETLYAGFDVTVSGSVGTVYFAHFMEDGSSFFGGRIFITSPTSGGDFAFGLSGSSTINKTWASDGTFGNTYRLVVSYDFDSGYSQLWVNPTLASDTSITATNGFAGDAFDSFALREASNPSTESIDNLTLATTFQEALTGVPEPATTALVALGGLAFVGMGLKRRK